MHVGARTSLPSMSASPSTRPHPDGQTRRGPYCLLSPWASLLPPLASGPLRVPSSWISQVRCWPGLGKMALGSLFLSRGPRSQPRSCKGSIHHLCSCSSMAGWHTAQGTQLWGLAPTAATIPPRFPSPCSGHSQQLRTVKGGTDSVLLHPHPTPGPDPSVLLPGHRLGGWSEAELRGKGRGHR